jgi:hypothetical protein
METAQQMDSALQRRSKAKTNAAPGTASATTQMTDSEKIALQMLLDGQSFGEQIQEISGQSCNDLAAYVTLMNELNESKRVIETK